MASTRAIKGKIKSVKSTQQITKAMNLVAASKLQRAKTLLTATRPYANEVKATIRKVVTSSKGISHPLMEERPIGKVLIIVLTGDRGLCGGFNVNVCKQAAELMKKHKNTEYSLIVVGTKGRDYFVRRNIKIRDVFSGISEKPFYDDAAIIGKMAIEAFMEKGVDEVYIVYSEFKSTITHEPTTLRLLPVEPLGFDEEPIKGAHSMCDYEPSPEAVLEYIIPKFVNTAIYGALVESGACEQGARMTSMDQATENAQQMIESYTLQFNRARQGAITQEITEIISGANALE